MPISLDPNAKIWFALENDQHKPAEVRPEFQARFPTIRQRGHLNKTIAAAADEKDDQKCSALLDEVIGSLLVGWRNMRAPVTLSSPPQLEDIPFDLAKLDDILTHVEKWEIAYTLLGLTRLTASEKKACGSPATSATALSVEAAAAAGV